MLHEIGSVLPYSSKGREGGGEGEEKGFRGVS